MQRILLKDTVTHVVSWEYSQGETEYIPQQDTNKTLTCDDVTATERTAVRGSTTVGTTSRSPELLVSFKSVSNIDRYLVKSLNNK